MGIVEALLALVSSMVEAIASIFIGAGETMGAGEAVVVFFLLLIELIIWLALIIIELIKSLFGRRKPKKIKKPIIWRKQKNKTEQIDKHS